MRPVLFERGGVTIRSYPAMLYVGLVAGTLAGNAAARAARIDALRVTAATLILLGPALVGARLFYAATHWEFYRGAVSRIWDRKRGGAAQYGGLLLALPLSVPVAGALHLAWGGFWDAAVFSILIAMIFGRAGCLLQGCCAGRLSSSRFTFHGRLPTQCLEAVWAACLLVLALAVRQRLPFPGALFWAVAGGYGAGRLGLESTREEGAGTFTIHHGLSAALIVLSLAEFASRWPRH
jgi:phosphatidylglycerol:prolipoprotein diacylglycerol transferase